MHFYSCLNVIIPDPDPHPRFYARIRIWQKDAAPDPQSSLADPEPEGSETFGRIRTRSGTDINVLDPDLIRIRIRIRNKSAKRNLTFGPK